MLRVRDGRDLFFAAALLALSLCGFWLIADLRLGTAMRMGPGYMPNVLCWLGIGLSLVIGVRGLAVEGPPLEAWAWRPLAAVSAACLAFISVAQIGIVAAVIVVALAACLGDRTTRWGQAVALALALATFAALAFVVGLKLPMPLWPRALVG